MLSDDNWTLGLGQVGVPLNLKARWASLSTTTPSRSRSGRALSLLGMLAKAKPK